MGNDGGNDLSPIEWLRNTIVEEFGDEVHPIMERVRLIKAELKASGAPIVIPIEVPLNPEEEAAVDRAFQKIKERFL